jgi:hypothetical protein
MFIVERKLSNTTRNAQWAVVIALLILSPYLALTMHFYTRPSHLRSTRLMKAR